jgi:hypothetical protein
MVVLIGYIINMLENYRVDEFGIIHQIEVQHFEKDYGQERNNYGEKSNYLSYLRLGFIIAAIGLNKIESILDIGFGNGDFLKSCEHFAHQKFGFDLTYKYLPACAKPGKLLDKYEVITMFDSLEHFNDLNIIFDLNCKYLILSVPNCKKPWDDNWLANWKHLRPNEHLHHMNLCSLLSFVQGKYSYICHSFVEDIIRKDNESENILTICLKKIN